MTCVVCVVYPTTHHHIPLPFLIFSLVPSTHTFYVYTPVSPKPITYSSSVLRASEYVDLDDSAVDALMAAVTSAAPVAVDKVVETVTTAVAATATAVPSEGGGLSSVMDFQLPDVGGLPLGVIAGAGVAVAAVFAVLQSKGSSSSSSADVTVAETTTMTIPAPTPAAAAPAAAAPAPVPVVVAAEDDISIPYDAAARLAYCKSMGIDSVTDEADFSTFKTSFEAQAVADATAKKAARDKTMV
jgi:hypothetical protein